jgi:hypothetical protein
MLTDSRKLLSVYGNILLDTSWKCFSYWLLLISKSCSWDNQCLRDATFSCGPCPAATVLCVCLCVWKCSSESVRAVCDLTLPGRKVKLSGHFIVEPRSMFTTFISFITYLSLSLFDRGCGGKANPRRQDVLVARYVISHRRINLNYAVRILKHRCLWNESWGRCDSQLRLYLGLIMLTYIHVFRYGWQLRIHRVHSRGQPTKGVTPT